MCVFHDIAHTWVYLGKTHCIFCEITIQILATPIRLRILFFFLLFILGNSHGAVTKKIQTNHYCNFWHSIEVYDTIILWHSTDVCDYIAIYDIQLKFMTLL